MRWESVKLNEVIEKPFSGEWGDSEGLTKVIRTTNFRNDGSLDLSDVVTRNISEQKIEKKKLLHGDIIIEKSGGSPTQPVGRVVYFKVKDETFLCNNFTSVIRPKKSIYSRYLFWCLYSGHIEGSTLQFQNKTTGIINLQLERFCNEFLVPLPPFNIQQQIADTLDKADALRRKDQALLNKYDELAQAIFYDMFGDPVRNEKGWEVKMLSELVVNKNFLRVPIKEEDRKLRHGVYPYFGATGQIDWFDDYKFDGEYLLIAEDGKNLLLKKKPNAFIVSGKFWVNNHAHVMESNGKVELIYLEYFFNTLDLKPYVTGIDQYKLNKNNLDIIPILVPTLKLQKSFKNAIDYIRKQTILLMKCSVRNKEIFKSLVDQYFS